MSIFDELKNTVEEFRPQYKSWVKAQRANFGVKKHGQGIFNTTEACAILEEFLNIIEVALKNKQQCITRISASEMQGTKDCLIDIKNTISNNDYSSFVVHVEEIISHGRPFELLSMEKMDEARYRQVSSMDETLIQLKAQQKNVNGIARNVAVKDGLIKELQNNTETKITELDEIIVENQSKANNLNNMLETTQLHADSIKSILDTTSAQQAQINEFVKLIQERQKTLASQESATEEYEEKLKEFLEQHDNITKKHTAERDELIEEVRKLTAAAQNALRWGTGVGLSKAFYKREEELSNRKIKLAWLITGGVLAAAAIGLGLVVLFVFPSDNITSIISRTFLMGIVVAVSAFCFRQYTKSRNIEEDYAYKAALVASYPGFAEEIDEPDMKARYVSKLLDEILQDPQRVRNSEMPHGGNEKSPGIGMVGEAAKAVNGITKE